MNFMYWLRSVVLRNGVDLGVILGIEEFSIFILALVFWRLGFGLGVGGLFRI